MCLAELHVLKLDFMITDSDILVLGERVPCGAFLLYCLVMHFRKSKLVLHCC